MSLEEHKSKRITLRSLPAPSDLNGDPWSLHTTRQVARMLGADPACLTVWRYRGIFPDPEPSYFKGSIQTYRVDRVQAWLAQRRNETYDQAEVWKEAIGRWVMDPGDDVQKAVREWVRLLGPGQWAPEGCRWRPGGFKAYLDSLGTVDYFTTFEAAVDHLHKLHGGSRAQAMSAAATSYPDLLRKYNEEGVERVEEAARDAR